MSRTRKGSSGRPDPDEHESVEADSVGADPTKPTKRRRGLLAPDEPLERPSSRERAERPPYDPAEGRGIIVLSWVGTVIFTLSALIGTIWLSTAAMCVIVSLVLFTVGTVAFISAFLRAVNRSRYEAIGMGGLYFLAGTTAPARVQALLLGSLGVQTVVALVAASVRMYTGLAFGILVPMFGLGLAGLWGARHGRFDTREQAPTDDAAEHPKRSRPVASKSPSRVAKKPPRVR